MSRFAYLTLALALLAANSSRAAVTNGSFETGNLEGWSAIGAVGSTPSVTAQPSIYTISPTAGGFQAQLINAVDISDANTATALQAALGMTPSRLTSLAGTGNTPVRGATLSQTITVNAGDVLEFDWNFLTAEIPPGIFGNNDDFAFWSLTSTTGPNLIDGQLLSRVNPGSLPPPDLVLSDRFTRHTGYQTTSFSFANSGTYLLGFGVIEVNASSTELRNSGLLLDNVRVFAIPEPSSAALLGLAASGLLFRRRRV